MPNRETWLEYPECPCCGAIQGNETPPEGGWKNWTCQSCGQQFQLEVQVTRRYRSTPMEEG